MKKLIFLVALLFTFSSAAHAIPTLQLGIDGGTYYGKPTGVDDTTVANKNSFNLIAYLLPNDDNTTQDAYYLSSALIRQGGGEISNSPATLGSFKIGSTTYNITNDMLFGSPPVNTQYRDLLSHDIFDTWYLETEFIFNEGFISPAINVADDEETQDNMYLKTFAIDLSGLAVGYGIHFDLYNLGVKPNGTPDISKFAPFSHDAEGWKQPTNPVVPEPGTIVLLGSGFIALALYGRRRKNS